MYNILHIHTTISQADSGNENIKYKFKRLKYCYCAALQQLQLHLLPTLAKKTC